MHKILQSYSTTFLYNQDGTGVFGLTSKGQKSTQPIHIPLDAPVVQIASGCDHLCMLTIDGDLYTMGCGEQGQLGRVAEIHAIRGGRKGPGRCSAARAFQSVKLFGTDCSIFVCLFVCLFLFFCQNLQTGWPFVFHLVDTKHKKRTIHATEHKLVQIRTVVFW